METKIKKVHLQFIIASLLIILYVGCTQKNNDILVGIEGERDLRDDDITIFVDCSKRISAYLKSHDGIIPNEPYEMLTGEPGSENYDISRIFITNGRAVVFSKVLPIKLNTSFEENWEKPVLFYYKRMNGQYLFFHWDGRIILRDDFVYTDVEVGKKMSALGMDAWRQKKIDPGILTKLIWDESLKMFRPSEEGAFNRGVSGGRYQAVQ